MAEVERAGVRPAIASGEAARMLGVSQTTVVNWIESGVLEGYAVPGAERRRHFVVIDSIARLQQGGASRAGPDGLAGKAAAERDAWRQRAVRAESEAALLREAFDEVLAATGDQNRANERLRRALEVHQRALALHAVEDEELSR